MVLPTFFANPLIFRGLIDYEHAFY